MTPRQAFKTAFLLRCADEGLDLAQTHERVKQALAVTEKRAEGEVPWGATVGAATGLAGGGPLGAGAGAILGNAAQHNPGSLAKTLLLLPIGIGAGLGVAGGKMLAEAQKDPLTTSEAQTNEELAELQRLTDRAHRMKQLRAGSANPGI